MGSNLFCDCNRSPLKKIATDSHGEDTHQFGEEFFLGRLTKDDIDFKFKCDDTIAYVIKTEKLFKFFNTKIFLKCYIAKNEVEQNDYYDKVVFTNFVFLPTYTFLILQKNRKKTKIIENLLSYRVDMLLSLSHKDNIKEGILTKISSYEKKNYFLEGIVSNLSKETNYKNFLFVFNKNKFEYNYEYSIEYFEEEKIDENNIKEILELNKDKIIKSVLKEQIEEQNIYFFIFEKCISNTKEKDAIDFHIMKLDKNNNSNDDFIREIVTTLNDVNDNYQLTAIISDKKSTYLIFYLDKEKNE